MRLRLLIAGCAALLVPLAVVNGAGQAAAGASHVDAGGHVSLTGVYTEVHGDAKYVDQTLYFLYTSGRHYRIKVPRDPGIRTGATVRVSGSLTGNTIDVTSGDIQVTAAAPRSVAAVGTKSVLVINVVWAGASLTATAPQEQAFLFGSDSRSVASYYRDASYGQLTWAGTVTPRYTITDPGTCDLYGMSGQAETAATAGGYDPASYDALIINVPALHCAAVGYGEVGGKHTWVENGLWNLSDGYAREVPTHEIGHSLGLYHSHGLECGAVTITLTCVDNASANNEEYGNAWDVMGNNWPGDAHDSVSWFSARQEIQLGWLTGSRVQNVTTSGAYALVPLEKSGTASPQVLVLSTPTHTYYIEYRQAIGQDAFMSAYPAATNSVHINVSAANGGDSGPFALDFTPNSSTGYYDWFDAPLPIGRSFTDPQSTFTISPMSQNGTTATINISFSGASSYPLTVARDGTGTGTVTSSPAGISCGATCSASYASGTSVTLTEAASAGSTFGGWTGACTGTASTCTVAMSAARSVGATFTASGTTYEETAVTLDGWGVATDVNGTYRKTTVAASTVQFPFSGTSVGWVTRKGPAQGKASVTIDGVGKGTVDLYSASPGPFTSTFSGLTAGSHTMVVKVLGTKNAAATDDRVAVDAFKVGSVTTQESAASVLFDSWRGAVSPPASGGGYRVTSTAGRTAILAFTGTGVDWVTSTGPGWGKAEVYIDGVDKGTVDLYGTVAQHQAVRSYRGLAAGRHTITVQALGTKNAAATSANISVDAFIVH